MKKFIILMLVFALMLTVFAACGQKGSNESNTSSVSNTAASSQGSSASDKVLKDPVTLKFLTMSHPSWPYDEKWWVWKALEERTNVHLDIIPAPEANYVEKFNLTMASGDIPDLLFMNDMNSYNKFANVGAFANISEKLNEMPNFSKLYNASDNNKTWVKRFMTGDGNLYILPNFGYGDGNRMCWIYREDIFTANNLSVPTTYDELYNVLKVLKEKYPDSIPFSFRNLFADGNNNRMNLMATQWGSGYPYYFNQDTKTWGFGPSTGGFKDLVIWLNKLYTEKLIPEDFVTLTSQQWEETMTSNKALVTVDYTLRINQYNKSMKEAEPNYKLRFMAPLAGNTGGRNKFYYTGVGNAAIAISSGSKKIDEAIKYLDWLYTDEARDLVCWGKEGETYNVQNGQKVWIKPAGMENDSVEKVYGLWTRGTYLAFDPTTFLVDGTPEYIESINETKKYDMPLSPVPAYNDEEAKLNNTVGQTITTKLNEEITKFILGQRSFSEWDSMIQEMKDLGLDQMLKAMNDSYARLNK